jgi:hypothetical protein
MTTMIFPTKTSLCEVLSRRAIPSVPASGNGPSLSRFHSTSKRADLGNRFPFFPRLKCKVSAFTTRISNQGCGGRGAWGVCFASSHRCAAASYCRSDSLESGFGSVVAGVLVYDVGEEAGQMRSSSADRKPTVAMMMETESFTEVGRTWVVFHSHGSVRLFQRGLIRVIGHR